MLAAVCAVVLTTMELVCSASVPADMADIIVAPPNTGDREVHMFASGGKMFDTHKQPTTPIFAIHEDSPVWAKAIQANVEHTEN